MYHTRDFFINLVGLSAPVFVTLANGKCVHVTHVGTVKLSSNLLSQGVLLLSISKLYNQEGRYIVFTPKCYIMQAPLMKRP